MFSVKSLVFLLALFVVCGCEPRKFYEDNQNDEDDSVDCNDGLKIDDSILLPFLKKLRGREMLPVRMKEWVILFDGSPSEKLFEGWNKSFLTEWGMSKEKQSEPFGEVFTAGPTNVYLPRLEPYENDTFEFRVMYAEQLLIDSIDKVKIVIGYRPEMGNMSQSSTRLLKVLLKRARPETVTVLSSSCPLTCVKDSDNPLVALASCGYVYGHDYKINCMERAEPLSKFFFRPLEASEFEKSDAPEFQVPLPVPIKKEFHSILDWLLKRIGQRMRNYMEMAFAKNRFRRTTTDIYNKVDLQISKIKGGQTFDMARNAENIYKSLFDLNVFLNVTNTPFTFDKFHTFNLYLVYVNQFSQGQLDTTKYANFFEPLKELCLEQMSTGSSLMKKATKIFELEDGVYDLNGAICHENVLFVVDGMTTMNTIKSGIYDNENCKFDTVFVLAKKNFTINEDLSVPGKNVIIFAPTWIILREHSINLTGIPGKPDVVQAGQSGGDFFGFGVKFENSDMLKVITSGGDGSDGREAPPTVTDPRFVEGKNGKCQIVGDKEEEIIQEYGASYGGPGGSPGRVTVKILLGIPKGLTKVSDPGREGSPGRKSDLTFVCENDQKAKMRVDRMANVSIPAKELERMSEQQVLELFRKVIKRNSKRLSYDVLNFYKDIWASPLMGQTLDSTLKDFLNSSDYTVYSKDFYEVTSQIMHTQIKRTCNMTDTQRTLVEFALVTINMKAPPEGVLPSEVDIDGFLEDVENTIAKRSTEDEYFKKKDLKFRKIIEEATYYLRESLLPSLNRSMTETHQFLRGAAQAYQANGNFSEGRKFQEGLVANNILRYVTELMSHIHVNLDDFVRKEEFESSNGGAEGDVQEEKLEKKLYFFRNLRNNVTANEMKAMAEFLRLLRETVVNGHDAQEGTKCSKCESVRRMAEKLESDFMEAPDRCSDCENLLNTVRKTRLKRFAIAPTDCEQCDGDCSICPECPLCQENCKNCDSCQECPWCEKCVEEEQDCNECSDCGECPECFHCLLPFRGDDCSTCPCQICPFCAKCRGFAPWRGNDCSTCPCQICPFCTKCRGVTPAEWKISDSACDDCQNCALCPECEICQGGLGGNDCSSCPCQICPFCPKCRGFAPWRGNDCSTCPCQICPFCAKCRGVTPAEWKRSGSACDVCQDCALCPECEICQGGLRDNDCSTCPCNICPFCAKCRGVTPLRGDDCGSCPCQICPFCPKCRGFAPLRGNDCSTCPCQICPFCAKCRGVTPAEWKSSDSACDDCRDCALCPECEICRDGLRGNDCGSCPCHICPFCTKCRGVTPVNTRRALSSCDECSDCKKCPLCKNCRKRRSVDSCDFCDDCNLCPDCPMCKPESKCQNCTTCRDCFACFKCESESSSSFCKNCKCSQCPFCTSCLKRFDEIEAGLFWKIYSKDDFSNVRVDHKSVSRPDGEFLGMDRKSEKRRSAGVGFRRLESDSETDLAEESDGQSGKLCEGSGPNGCSGTRSNDGADTCENCLGVLKIIRKILDDVFKEMGERCDEKAEKTCSNAMNILKKMGAHSDGTTGGRLNNMPIRLECNDCLDTLDVYINQLSSEVSNCEGECSEEYPKMKSDCHTEDEYFTLLGCDPETFSRTYEEILENFLNRFSDRVKVDPGHTGELDNVQKNFGQLLTIVDMLLQEGLSPSDVPLGEILHVTNNVLKFNDLKAEYQRKMTELYDFSETDVYDLFGSELSEQNQRLGMTSRWLNQLKKLVPWIRKVTTFLGANPKYQEVTERIREAMRLVSEIVHNVKLIERHRELRNYVKGVERVEEQEKTKGLGKTVSELKSNLRATFLRDVFNKAMTAAKSWVFPLTKSYLVLDGIRSGTYHSRLEAASKEIENYRKSIMLYTTVQNFENPKGDAPFYEWRVGTRPTLVRDLLSGKPVILVSEILDGGRRNALMAKDFEVNFSPRLRLAPGTKEKIDETLKRFWINVTHSGISYFKFGSRIYRRLTETFTFRHTAGSVHREKMETQLDYVLSPYTTWVLRMEPDSSGGYPYELIDQIGSIELVGKGRYIINCADIPDVNQYFTPLSDYGRRNEK